MRITVAITGASGSIYAHRLIERLVKEQSVSQIYVVMSPTAIQVATYEGVDFVEALTSPKVKIFEPTDYFAPIASGSNAADAMAIIPASMGVVGRIAAGVSTSLIERAADVQLKERRRLVVVARETPLSLIHLQNMVTITQTGGIILPASPSFYSLPSSVDQIVDTVVDRVLNALGIKSEGSFKWGA